MLIPKQAERLQAELATLHEMNRLQQQATTHEMHRLQQQAMANHAAQPAPRSSSQQKHDSDQLTELQRALHASRGLTDAWERRHEEARLSWAECEVEIVTVTLTLTPLHLMRWHSRRSWRNSRQIYDI